MIQLVIFDMAGTTIQEDNLVYKTIMKVMQAELPSLNLNLVLRIAAGKEKRQAITDIIYEIEKTYPDKDRVAKLFKTFQLQLKEAYDLYPMSVFPEVREMLKILKAKDIKIAFNTGYDRKTANNILKKTNLEIGKDLDCLVTASDVERNRPAPDMIIEICKKLQIVPEKTIKIGDSIIDIEEGKAAQVKYSIGITTGAQEKSILQEANPDFILSNMKELIPILDKA